MDAAPPPPALPDTMRQHMLQLIDSDMNDHLSPEDKSNFRKEAEALSHQVKKNYPKDDEIARPLVVGFQLKHEEALLSKYYDKALDNWKISIVFVTPKPVTPLCVDPGNKETWKNAIAQEVQDDPARLYTVLGRCGTVSQLLESEPNVTVYAFYPTSGFSQRDKIHQERYTDFKNRKRTRLVDKPMKYLQKLEAEEVGAIYIMQPPGTFQTSPPEFSHPENPLQMIEDELSQLQPAAGKDLKSQVFITDIGAGQAIDANKANVFSLCSGPLSNPDVQTCFNLRKNTISSGINEPETPPEKSTND